MAWAVQIAVKDLERRAVSVTATRTDDGDPTDVRTYNAESVVDLSNLPRSKAVIVDSLYAQYEADQARRAQIKAMIGGWEDALAVGLQAREGE